MIQSPYLKNFRIKELYSFIWNILMIVKQHGPVKLKVQEPYQSLEKEFEKLQDFYKNNTWRDLTPKLKTLDEKRDALIICLRQVCEGYRYHYNEKIQRGAEEVIDCIDKYGTKLYKLSYNEETAALQRIGMDLKNIAGLREAIESMHMQDVVKEMDQYNEKFAKMFIKRLENYSQRDHKSTKEVVSSIIEAYRLLIRHIDAYATLSSNQEYDILINHLNENIEHFNQRVEWRRHETVELENNQESAEEQNAPSV